MTESQAAIFILAGEPENARPAGEEDLSSSNGAETGMRESWESGAYQRLGSSRNGCRARVDQSVNAS
jgi:hypothetical protein